MKPLTSAFGRYYIRYHGLVVSSSPLSNFFITVDSFSIARSPWYTVRKQHLLLFSVLLQQVYSISHTHEAEVSRYFELAASLGFQTL